MSKMSKKKNKKIIIRGRYEIAVNFIQFLLKMKKSEQSMLKDDIKQMLVTNFYFINLTFTLFSFQSISTLKINQMIQTTI